MLVQREVKIQNTTFIVNRYSSKDATETLEELLKRVIVQNAEREFKKRPYIAASEAAEPDNSQPECFDLRGTQSKHGTK